MAGEAGTVVRGLDTPAHAQDSEIANELGFPSSTTYSVGTSAVACTFMAPTSGKVLILFGHRAESNTANVGVLTSVEVREGAVIGSGTIVSAADDDSAVETPMDATAPNNVTRTSSSRHRVVTGLTAGSTYNARLLSRVSAAGNGDMWARDLDVIPIIA